jgi:hypothetical protein
VNYEGAWYDAQRAQEHLRVKYDALAANNQIKTAEDFIEKAASNSSISGRPYQIECGDGAAMSTRQWFSAGPGALSTTPIADFLAHCAVRKDLPVLLQIVNRRVSP